MYLYCGLNDKLHSTNTRIIPTLRKILENLNIIEEILNETSLGTISFSDFFFFFSLYLCMSTVMYPSCSTDRSW